MGIIRFAEPSKAHLNVLNAELLRCVHSYRLSVDVREFRKCRTAVARETCDIKCWEAGIALQTASKFGETIRSMAGKISD